MLNDLKRPVEFVETTMMLLRKGVMLVKEESQYDSKGNKQRVELLITRTGGTGARLCASM